MKMCDNSRAFDNYDAWKTASPDEDYDDSDETQVENIVAITEKNLNDILYHLDSLLRLMGFGGEYNKIVNLLGELPLEGVDLSKYWNVNQVMRNKINVNVVLLNIQRYKYI
jgi:hypothetical protein